MQGNILNSFFGNVSANYVNFDSKMLKYSTEECKKLGLHVYRKEIDKCHTYCPHLSHVFPTVCVWIGTELFGHINIDLPKFSEILKL